MKHISLCSGIEAATVAWHDLGFEPVAFADIEPFPCRVLAHHYPDVPNLGDISKINGADYAGKVELIVAGTPCQDFSIAGKRAGLSGERSGLALHFVRLVQEIGPRWILWENVPGAFSTNGGRDFAQFLIALEQCGYSLAWRVLDAQFFGVPQRRRRIFLVGYSGDWQRPAKVLFESESLRRDHQASREAREKIASTSGRSFDSQSASGSISPAITSKWAKGTGGPAGDECQNLVVGTLTASGAGLSRPGGQGNELVFCILADQGGQQMSVCTGIVPTLRAQEHGHQPCVLRMSRRWQGCTYQQGQVSDSWVP